VHAACPCRTTASSPAQNATGGKLGQSCPNVGHRRRCSWPLQLLLLLLLLPLLLQLDGLAHILDRWCIRGRLLLLLLLLRCSFKGQRYAWDRGRVLR
jgi:hypothetical protein